MGPVGDFLETWLKTCFPAFTLEYEAGPKIRLLARYGWVVKGVWF